MRLILPTAAYWLMLTVRVAVQGAHPLASAEFNTLLADTPITGRFARSSFHPTKSCPKRAATVARRSRGVHRLRSRIRHTTSYYIDFNGKCSS